MTTTRYWHHLENGKIQCDLCPRLCQLKVGQRGFCFVRQRIRDKIELTTYGRSSGFCIDPIEKKPLNHFLPGTPVLSFGTAGCNLACKFCQNWDISKSRQMDTLMEQASPEKIADVALHLKCRSVAFTYNDPTIFLEYAVDVAKECHRRDLFTVAVTAGYLLANPREEFFQHIDAANIDLKAFTDRFYKDLCGARLEPVLETLEHVKKEQKTWLEITTLIIPGANDSDQEIDRLTQWVNDRLGPEVPVHFSAFHPDFKMPDLPATPHKTLRRVREIAQKNGLHHVYIGNVHDPEADSTYCASCKKLTIERDWYTIGKYHLTSQGQCDHCHHQMAGIFQGPPGTWGAKRQPVEMSIEMNYDTV